MSKGCAETVGDTSDDNPDPESPRKMRGQAARKGGWEMGSQDEETRSPTRRDAGDGCAEYCYRSQGYFARSARSLGTHFLFSVRPLSSLDRDVPRCRHALKVALLRAIALR